MPTAETPHDLEHHRRARFAPWAASWGGWGPMLALVAMVTLLRLAYLAWISPYALIEDEAHYWEWARRLDWSYYSKGPGIAWLIWLSTSIFGQTEFGVRAPAAVFHAVTALAVGGVALDAMRDRRAGFFAASIVMLIPVFQAIGLLMTIDGPYVACWALACWAAWHAMVRGHGPACLAVGAAIGAGFLFKYTILLLLPGLVLAAVLARFGPHPFRYPPRRWVLAGLAVATLGLLPVLIWNAGADWPTVRHLLGHLGLPGGDQPKPIPGAAPESRTYDPIWTLEFIGAQFLLVGPALVLGVVGGIAAWRDRHTAPRAWRGAQFLLACAVPLVVFYLLVTFFTRAHANWAIAAYTTLASIAGWAVARGMDEYLGKVRAWRARAERPRPRQGLLRRKPETPHQVLWHITLVFGLIAGLGMLRADWLSKTPLIGGVVPTGRLFGGAELATSIERILDEHAETLGPDPMIIAEHYGRASLLAFYLPDQPRVFSSSSLMPPLPEVGVIGGRRTQYDYWDDTDLRDVERLRGRNALLLGGHAGQWAMVFEEVRELGPIPGDHKRDRSSFLGYGYRGFPPEQGSAPSEPSGASPG